MWNHSGRRWAGLLGLALAGLTLPLDGCTVDFSLASAGDGGASILCGNGVKDDGEECDDANRVSGDGCSDACLQEA